jgi:hypothetical protein
MAKQKQVSRFLVVFLVAIVAFSSLISFIEIPSVAQQLLQQPVFQRLQLLLLKPNRKQPLHQPQQHLIVQAQALEQKQLQL